MPGLEKNRIYRAHIDGYSSEGLGIARIDGQVVFVHGAIRGEAPTTAAAAAATSGICPMRRSSGPSVPGSRTP